MNPFNEDEFPLDYDYQNWAIDVRVDHSSLDALIAEWDSDGDEEESDSPILFDRAA